MIKEKKPFQKPSAILEKKKNTEGVAKETTPSRKDSSAKEAGPNQEVITERGAGVLLHITSLHSPYGIGDLGPQARLFADFLSRGNQKYWQLLPLNPVEKSQGYSPYSSLCSMGGNTLLISPDSLVDNGLLKTSDVEKYQVQNKGTVNYEEALRIKTSLFQKAYKNFIKKSGTPLHEEYKAFCSKEAYWINDYALYAVIKQLHKGKAWYQWPESYKLHQEKAIANVTSTQGEAIEHVKWVQFIFLKQWKELREYCNARNIKLVGDLPFYVSYDSSDVWSNPGIFALDEDGNMKGVAGVPPDYFNSDGQLWGMPVFRWDVLKKQNYDWWVKRLSKNMELFDLLRLDHFRAFADYWEVPANEKTAINGSWKPGPGNALFNTVKKTLGKLPFIAEDLGEINDPVYELRDKFKMPGMKVLHFAFGDNLSTSDYIPHNYLPNFIAYTGTHDNNTTLGWYRKDISKKERKNLNTYLGKRISEKDIHIELAKLAYSSVARTVILPLQDILGLDETTRMNKPASTEGNWTWRLKPKQLTADAEEQLKQWTVFYNRA